VQLTAQLAGRRIVEVWKNGVSIVIRCEDGYEIQIGWKNPQTGAPVNGEPVVVFAGKRVQARGAIITQGPGRVTEIPHRREVGL
jgi:hypothetical protein